MNWAASVIPSENSSREKLYCIKKKDLSYRAGIWDTREVVEFPYLDIFKKIVDGSLSGTICIQSCIETRSEPSQHVLSLYAWHRRKHISRAALLTSLHCTEQENSGHLPLSVRRIHEDQALPSAEVRARARWGWERCQVHFRRGTPGGCIWNLMCNHGLLEAPAFVTPMLVAQQSE